MDRIFSDTEINQVLDKVYREEFGGHHPGIDSPIKFRAKIEDHTIWVWAVGKWRPILYYTPNKKIPSNRIQMRVIRSVTANCGMIVVLNKNCNQWLYKRDGQEIPIELDWL